jgi:N-acetylgalactosamine-6-sulfatase
MVSRKSPIFWKWTGKGSDQDYWPRLAIRLGDWKLVLTEDAKRAELYDLGKDRSESMDVSKSHPDIVAQLSSLSLAWSQTMPEKPNPLCVDSSIQPGSPK